MPGYSGTMDRNNYDDNSVDENEMKGVYLCGKVIQKHLNYDLG